MGSLTPVSYGKRNCVDLIDEYAATEPSRTVISIPRSNSDPTQGWQDVSFRDFANAINRYAHWIVSTVGPAKEGEYPTIAYIGPSDVRYLVTMAATIKAGYKALFISPRNNLESQLSLFEATNCNWVLHTPEYTQAVQSWLSSRSMKTSLVGSISEIFSPEPVPAFPFQKPSDEIEDKPAFVLHTSGSTGIPKPIICRHGSLAVADGYHLRPEFDGYPHIVCHFANVSDRLLCTTPLFHALGLYLFISISIYYGKPMVLPCTDLAMTPDSIVSLIKHARADGIVIAPSVLEEMSHEDADTEVLKAMKCVVFGGGGMASEAGDKLVKAGVPIFNVISTTEYGIYPIYAQLDLKDWRYFIFDDKTFGTDYRPVDEAFEQVIVRRDKKPGMQGIFYTFPDLAEYHTNDLYKPHPTKAHHWMHVGRADDVIAFSNGEKLNPVTIEQTISAHPALKRAVVVGQGKFQAAIFLDPLEQPEDEAAARELIEDIWPTIEKVNQQTVAHGRIAKHLVALSNPKKPIPSSAKGSLQRGAFLKLYKDEIDALYDDSKKSAAVELSLASKEALTDSLKKLITTALDVEDIEADTDFFGAGIDSLGIINLAKLISDGLRQAGVPSDRTKVATRAIYANSTPEKLAAYLLAQTSQNEPTNGATNGVKESQRVLEEYSIGPVPHIPEKPAPNNRGQTVILTGSTGSLGSYLLDQLQTSDSVAKVICLNRGADGRQRQFRASEERGLSTDFSKAVFLQADLSQPNIGLEPALYKQLLSTVDRIIHNAWPVNFNLSVESFAPSIAGVRNLAQFSFHAGPLARPGPVPESSLPDFALASTGYGQSKLVGDLILQQATEHLGVPTAIIRVGQISGPRAEKGAWNRHEWLPTIISSSLGLGKLPRDLGAYSTVDWVPVEDVASVILEISGVLAEQAPKDITGHFHIVNPAHVQWNELVPAVAGFYEKQGRKLEIVDFKTWVRAVEEAPADGVEIPAVKLLDTYKGLADTPQSEGFATAKTRGVSKTLDHLGPIDAKMTEAWCRQWAF
ncbi:hypothetical protein N7468_003137 [Penicillium chermesinum]|uniref:Carrier domain-containing protein n=1 Tax=Penicillium chermesinum TaxID=63820 RepID=A0A9W9P5W3_9EURO|nr:uncharacterized protein N7468_003137 [Penicillium chermesinum]KAJ5238518.1 hypothetical protein N7468_003137 [Penicillium chermesinum]KAJ6164171.1 hypothetical protein N7470_002843 [Penicillium chermesinum]